MHRNIRGGRKIKVRVLIILVDGMRPDALADVPEAQELIKRSAYTMEARTVMPSVTLPCHMSLFHSVEPERHGITSNIYMPQVRPIKGLCEVLSESGKSCAFFYNWEELRDVARPGSLAFSYFCNENKLGYEESNNMVTDAAMEYLNSRYTDFAFVYLGYTDEAGHNHGWMGEEYMESVRSSWKNIAQIMSTLDDDYTVIVTADHGGHARTHGTDMPEDMLIPLIIHGEGFAPGCEIEEAGIKDIAPTAARLLGVEPAAEWEGKSFI